MWRDALLAFGLLMSTASQLRPGGSPIGAGELSLVAWAVLMTFQQMVSGGIALTPALSMLLRFWAAFSFAEALGFVTGLVLGVRTDPQWFVHDVLAYPLVAIVSCLSAAEAAPRIRRVAWLLALFGTAALTVQLAAAGGLVQIPPMEPWYWDRMRGWSANPNQLAFLCAALCLTSLHLADTAGNRRERGAALGCAVLPIVVGRMTGSDTFTLMILAALLVFLILKLAVWLRQPSSRLEPHVAFALMLVIAIPIFASSMVPMAVSMSTATDNLAMGLMKNGGKEAHEEADLRFALWQQAIVRGTDAFMLGLGPGPHLAIPPSLVSARASEAGQPGNIQHPQNNGTANFEAHNTILDLFVQGGLLAVLSFLWLFGSALLYSYRARLAGLTTLIGCLTFFGMTNLIIRQPLFWFAIVYCLVAGASRVPVVNQGLARLSRNKLKAVL